MSVIGDVFGAGGVAALVGKAVDRIWPDTTEQDKAKIDLLKEALQGEIEQNVGQLEINKIEAASASLFVAGWRPFIGWVCGVALGYQYIAMPLLIYGARLAHYRLDDLPALDYAGLSTILLGMLGLGGLRTFEKLKGVTR